MCILFFQLNKTPKNGLYRLVLANNRDEYWARPTAIADFWGKDKQCLSGLDEEPTREGGTWLGMNKQGKAGALLNILGENLPNRKGRGFLVSNFLTSSLSAKDYTTEVAEDTKKSSYNGFHLVLIEAGGQSPSAMVLSEKTGDAMDQNGYTILPLSEYHAFGNSAHSTPWQKVVHGRDTFQKIVENNTGWENKSQLVDQLMALLNNRTPDMPDRVLQDRCAEMKYSDQITSERSAVCVWSPSIQYGTRTNTVILVDEAGNCDYIEKTLATPVINNQQHLTTKTFTFKLDVQNNPQAVL